MPTGKEMCEYIVNTFPDVGKTAKELWEASPNGDLSHVYSLYASAREQNGLPAFEDPEMQGVYESYLRSKGISKEVT